MRELNDKERISLLEIKVLIDDILAIIEARSQTEQNNNLLHLASVLDMLVQWEIKDDVFILADAQKKLIEVRRRLFKEVSLV